MILAIDTSTQFMGISVYDGAQMLYEKVWKTNRRHTVELSPAVQGALKEINIELSALSAIAVALGPGSFTSLRIGLAFVKGLSFSLQIPVFGIPSLDVTAYGQPLDEVPMICVLKAGRGRYAAQDYKNEGGAWVREGNIYASTASELETRIESPTIIRGEIEQEDRRVLKRRWRNALVASPSENVRRPAHLAEIAWKCFQADESDDVITLEPIYLQTLANAN